MKRCPHSLIAGPESCSQCLGAPVRKIAIVGNSLEIDGITARPTQLVEDHSYQRRGGNRHKKRIGTATMGRKRPRV